MALAGPPLRFYRSCAQVSVNTEIFAAFALRSGKDWKYVFPILHKFSVSERAFQINPLNFF